MTELLSSLLSPATQVFAVASMLSVGFGYTVQQILGPLRDTRSVIRALVANFVLVPLLAVVVVQLVSLDQPLEVGLILIATAAGAPFLIKLTQAAEGDLALAATLLVLLLPVTVAYMPIVVPLAVPDAEVSAGAIAMPLVLTMLLPLAVGLFVRARSPGWAGRLKPIMGKVSSAALVLLIAATLLTNLQAIMGIFGEGAILASLLVIAGAFGFGYLLGGPDADRRGVLGLGTGQRNIAAATVVATQAVGDPNTTVMVVVSSMVGFAILFPAAWWLRRRTAGGAETEAGRGAADRRAA